jgi:hypothetical protein
MSAGQELLPRRSLTERFAPLVSPRVPPFGPASGGLRGDERRLATVTANLPDHTFTIATNCRRDGQKNPDANTLFWLDLTIFRMNTCRKRVGGWGCRILAATSTLFGFGCRNLRFQGCGLSTGQPRVGVQLHPRSDCATVRLKVRVRTSREAAVPCAHL